jgi:hypothetical protein
MEQCWLGARNLSLNLGGLCYKWILVYFDLAFPEHIQCSVTIGLGFVALPKSVLTFLPRHCLDRPRLLLLLAVGAWGAQRWPPCLLPAYAVCTSLWTATAQHSTAQHTAQKQHSTVRQGASCICFLLYDLNQQLRSAQSQQQQHVVQHS